MTDVDLRSVNLNLLAAFDALLTERSVTRAARRVGITQSAMSSALARLRELFGDPLFRRASHGIEPTARALAAASDVRAGLQSFARALAPPTFDPATSTRRFVVATSDFVELVLLPRLLSRIRREAPLVRLELRPWGLHEVPPHLASGDVDLVIGFFRRVPPGHRHAALFDDVLTCVVRRDHPRVRRRLTLDRWLELEHVVVTQSPESPGVVDVALARIGKSRVVGARVSHFLLAPVVVARTDMVAAVSERVVATFAPALKLACFPPPVPIPRGRVRQVWHDGHDRDPGHRWLRSIIEEECREV